MVLADIKVMVFYYSYGILLWLWDSIIKEETEMIYAFFAEGLEEIEGLAVVDVLRRAGIETEIVSITGNRQVTGSHNITIQADKCIQDVDIDRADVIFLPGGMPGTLNLAGCEELMKAVQHFYESGKRLAAICAAPSILGNLGILKGKKATCYPGFEDKLLGAEYCSDKVVTDGTITTAKGMGAAIELGLELIRILQGEEAAEKMKNSIIF